MTTGGMYTKDLRIFADRSLDQMVLIDNAAYSYAWQVDNGVPIIPYYENKADRELEALGVYLKGMIGHKDVREYNRYTTQHIIGNIYDCNPLTKPMDHRRHSSRCLDTPWINDIYIYIYFI